MIVAMEDSTVFDRISSCVVVCIFVSSAVAIFWMTSITETTDFRRAL